MEDIKTRREFFKGAINKTLPLLIAIYSPNIITSCSKPDNPSGSGGGSSSTGCTGHCISGCRAAAYFKPSGCSGDTCKSACYHSCKSLCYTGLKKL